MIFESMMQASNNKKRTRSENWTKDDRDLLMKLVKGRVNVIENKNSDTSTNIAKKKAWIAIHASFNSLCQGGVRTLLQIKNQWCDMKVKKKRELSKTGAPLSPSPPGLYMELDKGKVNAVVNKNTDTNTSIIPKQKSWIEVQDSFNSLCQGGERPLTQIESPPHPQSEEECDIKPDISSLSFGHVTPVPQYGPSMNNTVGGPATPQSPPSSPISYRTDLHQATASDIAETEKLIQDAKLQNEERKAKVLDLQHKLLKYQVQTAELQFLKAKLELEKLQQQGI